MTVEITYASVTDTTALTITLANGSTGLASDSSLLVGRESTVVSNVSNKHVDALVTGLITTGTSPTANRLIEVWAFVPIKIASSALTYPPPVAGTGDAGLTFTTVERKNRLALGVAIPTSSTSDHGYGFAFSLASLFGGIMPSHWGIFVVHNTGVPLNVTAANNYIHYQGIKYTDV